MLPPCRINTSLDLLRLLGARHILKAHTLEALDHAVNRAATHLPVLTVEIVKHGNAESSLRQLRSGKPRTQKRDSGCARSRAGASGDTQGRDNGCASCRAGTSGGCRRGGCRRGTTTVVPNGHCPPPPDPRPSWPRTHLICKRQVSRPSGYPSVDMGKAIGLVSCSPTCPVVRTI